MHYEFKSSQVKSSQSHTAHPARAGTGDYHFDGSGPTLKGYHISFIYDCQVGLTHLRRGVTTRRDADSGRARWAPRQTTGVDRCALPRAVVYEKPAAIQWSSQRTRP